MKILFTLIILSILFPMFIFADSSVSTPIGASFTEQNSTKFKRNLDYNVRQANIKIIESQSENTEHDMDINWQTAAANLEHEVEILPQVTLDDTLFFENTDILIISSGVISISQNRRDIIQQYVQQGGNAYIQGEYLSSYDSNQLFQQIVNNLGGFFEWGETVSGDLIPMNIMGVLSNMPNQITELTYFWYGNEGSGNETIENYLEYGGLYFGFIFTSPDNFSGEVISNSDQDWARSRTENIMLMENIISRLTGNIVDTNPNQLESIPTIVLNQNYPNPFNPKTTVSFSLSKRALISLRVYNIKGQIIKNFGEKYYDSGFHSIIWNGKGEKNNSVATGVYFYEIIADNTQKFRKVCNLIK